MANRYDTIIIGTGQAGPSLAGYVLTGLDPDPRAAHRPIGVSLSTVTVLRGAPGHRR